MLQEEQRERVAILRLDRPKRKNALSMALVTGLRDRLDALDQDDDVGAIVLGSTTDVFSAGGDLKDGLQATGVVDGQRSRQVFVDLLEHLAALGTPVIAAVEGEALGGGLGLVSGCDLAVAGVNASFGTPEIKVGLFPWTILAVLQRDIPRKRLLEMALTGGSLNAEEARELGLVNRVVSAGMAEQEAVALGARVASFSPAIIGMGKQGFHHISDLNLHDALAFMGGQLTLNLMTEDASEGLMAFLQRRQPEWKGH